MLAARKPLASLLYICTGKPSLVSCASSTAAAYLAGGQRGVGGDAGDEDAPLSANFRINIFVTFDDGTGVNSCSDQTASTGLRLRKGRSHRQ